MKKYLKSAYLSATEKTNGGIIYLMPDLIIKFFTLVPLIYLWRVLMQSGVQTGMSLGQMLTYTYVSSLLSDILIVKTAASGWLSEGVLLKLYGRPLSVIGQLIAQTIGSWIPNLILFSLPMAIISPIFGVNLIPASKFFPLSLMLCASLGFAIDILFACLSIKLRNINWLINRIRMAIAALFSGTVIPIKLLPFGIAEAMKYQPFASLGGAALSIYTSSENSQEILVMQIFWNLILWPFALFVFHKSQEGVVSYGG